MSTRFESMGCTVVVGGGSRSGVRAIESLFEERDRIFSRFRPDSELNRVNAAAGRAVRLSDEFAAMLELALRAADETGGLVDPTVGRAVLAAGYDADFALLTDDGPRAAAAPARAGSIRLAGRNALVPAGVQLDLNGVVKGKTVDDALELLDGHGFVSAGGDLASRGRTVVALPSGGAVELVAGALATSGTDRRRWVRDGVVQHHLIDPRTGRPSDSPWEQVTVCGASCVGADVAAKAAFLLGDDGPDWLAERGLPGRFVALGGAIAANSCWRAVLEPELVCT